MEPLKIAVVGGGVAGITAAYQLSKKHNVTLFEKNDYLGGHTNTRVVDGLSIDTGFIVCNTRNYPNFYKLLAELGVSLRDAEMSFGFCCEKSGLEYIGPGFSEFLRNPSSLLRKDFRKLVLEQRKFNLETLKRLKTDRLPEQPLKEYLSELELSDSFVSNYIVPIVAAVWSAPDNGALQFPLATLATFFNHHGMLELSRRPQWQTIVGGSHAYIRKFKDQFKGKIYLDSPIAQIRREADAVEVTDQKGERSEFDKLIVATHADQALLLLSDPSKEERALLGSWNYNKNRTVLHTDNSVMPKNKRIWASWNYMRSNSAEASAPVNITYYMNRLQGLVNKNDYFVTLNHAERINSDKIIYDVTYEHPVYTSSSVTTQAGLRSINGNNNTYYCGSYMKYGFHEDAVSSALEVAEKL